MSNLTVLLVGAAAGIAVTVGAYQFLVLPSARASSPPPRACSPAALTASSASTAPSFHPAARLGPSSAVAAQIRQKEGELAALRASLAASQAAAADAEARAEAIEGKPRDWPANLPPAYRGDALEGKLNALLDKSGLGTLADLNCDEYPCVAVIEAKNGDENWQKKLQAALKGLAAGGEFGPGMNISMWGSYKDSADENGARRFLTAVALIPQGDNDPDLQKRTGNRAGSALSNLR